MDFNLPRGGMPQLPPQVPMFLLIPGVLLIGLGVLVIWNPFLIQYMVAGVFIVLGLLLVLAGRRMQRMLK
jgi:uncharacterized membrane protein HdeD (DUF308 family)